jgi:hypothetical protein
MNAFEKIGKQIQALSAHGGTRARKTVIQKKRGIS